MLPIHLLLAGTMLTTSQGPATGRDLIRAMHDRYSGTWYHTLSFVQHNTATAPDGKVEHSTWREYAALPGRLRIEFEPAADGKGALFANDSQYVFDADTLTRAEPFVHPLMVLGFDVYVQPVERTLGQLERLGIDLGALHEDTWQGRPAYVVGAKPGDLHARQFWIDRERLVFVRMLEPGRRDSTKTSETRFNRYEARGGAWLSPEVEFLSDGRQRWLEQYVEIRTDMPLADALFDARKWNSASRR